MVSLDPRLKDADHVLASMARAKHKTPVISVDDMSNYAGQTVPSTWEHSIYDGAKFFGGFGATQIQNLDYWTLRARSSELFNSNLYARGLIRRLVTNEINAGLTPECTPDEGIIGVPQDSLNEWTERVENLFALWSKNGKICDWRGKDTFGAIQRQARLESLVAGDVLAVSRVSKKTGLPKVQIISGGSVQTPLGETPQNVRRGHEIIHGVERDKRGTQVAYWVRQKSGNFKRLPAYGEKSGRRIAWLVYGTEKRHDDVRGMPLLGLVLQSLKEIDRYRDSVQRKAVINSTLAMFIQKDEDKISTLPISGGATRKDQVAVTDGDGKTRNFNIAKQIPGLVLEELQKGEKPVGFNNMGTDQAFGTFEEAVIQAVAWANEIPPEILRLAFSNNYSASQAAINEFKIYLNLVWTRWGEEFCTPIYIDWLLAETLRGTVRADGLLDAWRQSKYDVYGAWTSCEWYGNIKPSTDMLKQAKGSQLLVREGWSTNAREARITTGTKFSKNIKRLKQENEQKAAALRPLIELEELAKNSENQSIQNMVSKIIKEVEIGAVK